MTYELRRGLVWAWRGLIVGTGLHIKASMSQERASGWARIGLV
jgi:hypothetical protein